MLKLPFPVVLASASPRRKELLGTIVKDFRIEPADLDEETHTVEDPIETAKILAYEKAKAVRDKLNEGFFTGGVIVIGSDTVVALETENGFIQFGKPQDAEDAKRMLRQLSGRTHIVVTGVAVLWPYGSTVGGDVAKVTFHELSEEQIEKYVATGESLDKAGAYGIQGMASVLVKQLEGSQDTVVGLPVKLVETMLKGVNGS